MDLLKSLVPVLARFPKNQKHLLGDRLQNTLTDVLELLVEAYYAPTHDKTPLLRRVNVLLEKLRIFNRVCFEIGFYDSGRYKQVAQEIDQIGNMNGGWLRSLGRDK